MVMGIPVTDANRLGNTTNRLLNITVHGESPAVGNGASRAAPPIDHHMAPDPPPRRLDWYHYAPTQR